MHQDFQWAFETWLRTYWAEPRGNRVYHGINVASVGGWPDDYRIPDLVLLTPDRFDIDHNEYFEGAPAVVVEIRSPDDESYEKFAFYSKLGVPEVWVVDRDTKTPEVYVLSGGDYAKQAPDRQNWVSSPLCGVQMRAAAEDRLEIQVAADPGTRRLLP
jgi:Uma2 family endonuclease